MNAISHSRRNTKDHYHHRGIAALTSVIQSKGHIEVTITSLSQHSRMGLDAEQVARKKDCLSKQTVVSCIVGNVGHRSCSDKEEECMG